LFPIKARAETNRLALHISGVPFEDVARLRDGHADALYGGRAWHDARCAPA
jgi:hypothetical protein